MTITDAVRQRDDFLNRLDAAMQNVPHGVATEIRAGIVEELEGLDAAATAARIAQLGDPAVIAHEAQAEVPAPATMSADPKAPASNTRGFAVIAALVLSFGGIVVPAVGWVVGTVMVCCSPMWRTWEKVIAIVMPLVIAGVLMLVGIVAWQGTGTVAGGSSAEAMNPLVPVWYDFVWMGAFGLGILLIPASGLWLLWRLRRR